jgi:hypothetical protein
LARGEHEEGLEPHLRLAVLAGGTYNGMNNSNSANSGSPRVILKLKPGARKLPREDRAVPHAQPHVKARLKSDAHWSDEYKERMQADMDLLNSR